MGVEPTTAFEFVVSADGTFRAVAFESIAFATASVAATKGL